MKKEYRKNLILQSKEEVVKNIKIKEKYNKNIAKNVLDILKNDKELLNKCKEHFKLPYNMWNTWFYTNDMNILIAQKINEEFLITKK